MSCGIAAVVVQVVASLVAMVSADTLMYPFGSGQGDAVLPRSDDGSSGQVQLAIDFPFYNSTYKTLFVMTNGLISFTREVKDYTPRHFSYLDSSYVIVAPYWADVDTTIAGTIGRIYFRQVINTSCKQSTDAATPAASSTLARLTNDIQKEFGTVGYYAFQACWAFIATWQNVTFYGGSQSSPTNTCQAVLVSDGDTSFIIFNYDNLRWTSGTQSGGNQAGLGGPGAVVGFKSCCSGFIFVPWSLLENNQILNMATSTNVGVTGRWAWLAAQAAVSDGCLLKDFDILLRPVRLDVLSGLKSSRNERKRAQNQSYRSQECI